jgi:hypothetical protein
MFVLGRVRGGLQKRKVWVSLKGEPLGLGLGPASVLGAWDFPTYDLRFTESLFKDFKHF